VAETRGRSFLGSQYQRTGEDTAYPEDSVRAVVNCSVRNRVRLNGKHKCKAGDTRALG
jgi:hypothetical protein